MPLVQNSDFGFSVYGQMLFQVAVVQNCHRRQSVKKLTFDYKQIY